MSNERIKIALLDDHIIVREGIKSLLSTQSDFIVIGSFNNYNELLEILQHNPPDIILLDISLPGKSGIEILQEIYAKYCNIDIIMLSMYIDKDYIIKSFENGAKAYLPKNTSKDDLFEAIRTVNDGGEYCHPTIAKLLIHKYKSEKENNGSLSLLSKREIEVLALYAEGKTNKEIADILFISPRTVESHKSHIMTKLNIKSQIDMVKLAIKTGVIAI